MLANVTIVNEKIELKSIDPRVYSGQIIQWLNDPYINKYLVVRHKLITVSDEIEHIELLNSSPTSYYLGVFLCSESRLVGTATCRIKNASTLEIGILIGEKELHGTGLGAATLTLVEKFAKSLSLKKLSAGIECENQASLSLFLKMKFKIEKSFFTNEYGTKCIQVSKNLDYDQTQLMSD
jgi:RimJ/RimL family protein N-acetyltransferase